MAACTTTPAILEAYNENANGEKGTVVRRKGKGKRRQSIHHVHVRHFSDYMEDDSVMLKKVGSLLASVLR